MRGRRENPDNMAAVKATDCPSCGASRGEHCKTRRGAQAWPPHGRRMMRAADLLAEDREVTPDGR